MRFAGQAMGGGFADYLAGNNATYNSGAMNKNNLETRGREKNMVHQAESQAHQFGLKAVSEVKAAEAEAEALIAQGQAAGQTAMMGGLMDGIGGIANAGISKWGSGGGGGGMSSMFPLGQGFSLG